MPDSKQLLAAILAMDAYNRGYEPGIADLGGVGSRIGSAEIDEESNTRLDSEAVASGFYALSYVTPYGLIISYRGTDKNIAIETLWKDASGSDLYNGYGIGSGSSTNDQGHLAAEFFQDVTGYGEADPRGANAILTGHSLGGGLAGFVGALYHQEAILFDNMPFEAAAVDAYIRLQGLFGAINLWEDSAFWGWDDYYNGFEPWQPLFPGKMRGFAESTEFLRALRVFQSTPIEHIDSGGSGLNPFTEYHSMALLVSLIYAGEAEADGGLKLEWRQFAEPLWNAFFESSNELGEAIGFDPKDKGGTATADGKMRSAIAYSALEGDGLVFGDAAIRAMFDDAQNLGEVFSQGFQSELDNDDVKEALAAIEVQFAGDLAFAKSTDSKAREGAFKIEDDLLKVDLDPECAEIVFT